MQHNRITIFSCGIADFRRCYRVKKDEPEEISIAVKQDHVADVLASLNVYGEVALAAPPRFRPSNAGDANITIQPANVLEDLATKLHGAKVQVFKPEGLVEGILAGLHTEETVIDDEHVHRKLLVVLTKEGLTKIPFDQMLKLCFVDDVVQNELDKALQHNLEQIKPGSTFVTLAVSTEQDEAEAILQYSIPAAAWKISYRLLQRDDGPVDLHGFAIVDNNTDEDWHDVLVSVVTGEPVTFSTDLAESKIPSRSHVNIVKEVTVGAVEPEELIATLQMVSEVPDAATKVLAKTRRPGVHMTYDAEAAPPSAAMEAAETRHVGDFCIYESKLPVDIPANRSALLPVFQARLDDARTVLHYKSENHPERPFRAVHFRNETPYSLTRGVCTVYEDGVYSGSSIMPATKPEVDCLLPHALETGVLIHRDSKQPEWETAGIRLSDGFCYLSKHQRRKTTYRVKNNTSVEYELLLDHDGQIRDAKARCDLLQADDSAAIPVEIKSRLRNGFRVVVTVAAKDQFAVQVTESRTEESSIALAEELNVHWLQEHLVATNCPLADNEGVRKCLDVQRGLDQINRQIQEAESEIERLAAKQERLRKNISTGGHDDQTTQWRTELGKAEERITQLEEQVVPGLKGKRDELRDELRQTLMDLNADWQNPEAEEPPLCSVVRG